MNLQAISPPLPFALFPKACTNCKGDVRSDRDFADLDGEFGAYVCYSCALYAHSGTKLNALIGAEQMKYLKSRQQAGLIGFDYNNLCS